MASKTSKLLQSSSKLLQGSTLGLGGVLKSFGGSKAIQEIYGHIWFLNDLLNSLLGFDFSLEKDTNIYIHTKRHK
jgi:hypothetical protein